MFIAVGALLFKRTKHEAFEKQRMLHGSAYFRLTTIVRYLLRPVLV
jgi:hypothetical protein